MTCPSVRRADARCIAPKIAQHFIQMQHGKGQLSSSSSHFVGHELSSNRTRAHTVVEIATQQIEISRPEAIRRLVEIGLKAKEK